MFWPGWVSQVSIRPGPSQTNHATKKKKKKGQIQKKSAKDDGSKQSFLLKKSRDNHRCLFLLQLFLRIESPKP